MTSAAIEIRPDPGKRTVTAKQIADAVDYCPRTIIRRMKSGKLKRLPGRPYRAYPSDVLKWFEIEASS